MTRLEPPPDVATELAGLVEQYRLAVAKGDEARKAQAEVAYNEVLLGLGASGWDGALGEQLELPDEALPAAYVERRGDIIQQLREELGELAARYRGATAPQDFDEIVAAYHAVYDQLRRVGHFVWPHPHNHLAMEDMPPSFVKELEEGIARLRAQRGDP